MIKQAVALKGLNTVMQTGSVDWSACPLVERVTDRMNGQPVVKGTRMPADGVVENYATGSPVSEIAENFGLNEAISARS